MGPPGTWDGGPALFSVSADTGDPGEGGCGRGSRPGLRLGLRPRVPAPVGRERADGARAHCLVALHVPVLAPGGRRLPGDLQLAGRQRVHLHVLRGHGRGCGESRTGGWLRRLPAHGGLVTDPSPCPRPPSPDAGDMAALPGVTFLNARNKIRRMTKKADETDSGLGDAVSVTGSADLRWLLMQGGGVRGAGGATSPTQAGSRVAGGLSPDAGWPSRSQGTG